MDNGLKASARYFLINLASHKQHVNTVWSYTFTSSYPLQPVFKVQKNDLSLSEKQLLGICSVVVVTVTSLSFESIILCRKLTYLKYRNSFWPFRMDGQHYNTKGTKVVWGELFWTDLSLKNICNALSGPGFVYVQQQSKSTGHFIMPVWTRSLQFVLSLRTLLARCPWKCLINDVMYFMTCSYINYWRERSVLFMHSKNSWLFK